MNSVVRLILVYFTGSAVTRWFTLAGLLLMAASLYVVTSVAQAEHMLAFAFTGLIAFFLGSSSMPATVSRLSRSHAAVILPGARVKLLASIYLTVLLVALPAGLLTPLAYVAGMSADLSLLRTHAELRAFTTHLAVVTVTSACLAAAWLYVFMWLVTTERNLVGFVKGMLVAAILSYLPAHDFEDIGPAILWNLQVLAISAVAFGIAFIAWPRWKSWRSGHTTRRSGASASRHTAGKEVDLVLGNANPWLYIATLTVPILLTSRFSEVGAAFWLLYLTIASIFAGATAGQAAPRSHALWLRGDWSREALFDVVEKSSWRHNGAVLAALVVFLLVVGAVLRLELAVVAAALPLLIVGTALSTYLGLWLTRGVRVPEAILAVAAMLALMYVALTLASGRPDYTLVSAAIAGLAVASTALRRVAQKRWARIDWLLCRADRQADAR